jgi:hypothetical protein
MMKIPGYAKEAAAEGLRARELFPKKPGLTKEEAGKLGINSGVERAKQIIREEQLEEHDLRSMARFYARFRNYHTPRAEVALLLWGGREFLEEIRSGRQASTALEQITRRDGSSPRRGTTSLRDPLFRSAGEKQTIEPKQRKSQRS